MDSLVAHRWWAKVLPDSKWAFPWGYIMFGKVIVSCVLAVAVMCCEVAAQANVFNMGGTRNPDGTWTGLASVEMVTVGDAGNVAYTGAHQPWMPATVGAVAQKYNIGKYEVTAGQYTEFLNAVAKTDTYGLWNSTMSDSSGNGCGVLRTGASGSYEYSVTSDWANRPVNCVTFWDACRFVNWLQNGQRTGLQNATTTENGAYALNGYTGSDGTGVFRNSGAKFYLPNDDQWFKAAYYKGGGTNAGYWTFATQSNIIPVSELPPGRNEPPGSANYRTTQLVDPVHHTTEVGAYVSSPGTYGTFDQAGNVSEWDEQICIGYTNRAFRGGAWSNGGGNLYPVTSVGGLTPDSIRSSIGFRIAGVPEPCSLVMLFVGAISLLAYAWRRRRAA